MRHPTNRRQRHPKPKKQQRIQRTPLNKKPQIQNPKTKRHPLVNHLGGTETESAVSFKEIIKAITKNTNEPPHSLPQP